MDNETFVEALIKYEFSKRNLREIPTEFLSDSKNRKYD